MRTHWQNIAVAFGLVLIAGLLVLAGVYPYRPNSIAGWFALFVFALPLVLVFEFAGEKLLKPNFVSRLGRTGRVIYGVLVLSSFIIVVLVAFQFVEPFFGKWGS